MEFWGVEVKPGKSVKCDLEENKFLHLSQASLGDSKGKENVPLYVKINDQKLVIGTLNADKCAQTSFDLVFEKEFELSHTSKNTSVYFCGYKSIMQEEQSDNDDYPESESEPEDVSLGQSANGKTLVKQDQEKSGTVKANAVEDGSAAKKAKKAEPAKSDRPKVGKDDDESENEDEDDEDDSEEDSESDEEMAEQASDDEDEDESSEEDDATPQKAAPGKRPADSASKTPNPEKKAKIVTPAGGQKTGGAGKKEVHVATPYPAKKAGKTPANSDKLKQQSPKSQQTPKSVGSVTCKQCLRTFNSDNALQSHTKAKHS